MSPFPNCLLIFSVAIYLNARFLARSQTLLNLYCYIEILWVFRILTLLVGLTLFVLTDNYVSSLLRVTYTMSGDYGRRYHNDVEAGVVSRRSYDEDDDGGPFDIVRTKSAPIDRLKRWRVSFFYFFLHLCCFCSIAVIFRCFCCYCYFSSVLDSDLRFFSFLNDKSGLGRVSS